MYSFYVIMILVIDMNLLGSKTFETERLFLRKSSMQEQKRLWEILMIPEVNKWYLTSAKKHANDKNHWSWDSQEKFYQMKVEKASLDNTFCWSIFLKGDYSNSGSEEVIGQISSPVIDNDEAYRDIGWFIDPLYQRNGYSTEAARVILKYLFDEVNISTIISCAVKDNRGSCKLFEKLGFMKTGEEMRVSPYTFYEGNLIFNIYELNRERYKENN